MLVNNNLYQIRIHGIFESAHYLYNYYPDGSNEELHGHTWEAELFIMSPKLQNGISIDFLDIRKKFDKLILDLDHTCLNDLSNFKNINPTAENIAFYIFTNLKDIVPQDSFISESRVWEGPKNYASYFPKHVENN